MHFSKLFWTMKVIFSDKLEQIAVTCILIPHEIQSVMTVTLIRCQSVAM